MSQLVETEYYDELIPFICRISNSTKKVQFQLPARFGFQPEKIDAFASQWSQENIWAMRPPNDYGYAPFGPLLYQLIEVTITDAVVFDYLFGKIMQTMAEGQPGDFHTSLIVEL